MCDWFVNNKLSIHFGEDKTKSIPFFTKNKMKKIGTLEIKYGSINIKQCSKVTYLGCELDKKKNFYFFLILINIEHNTIWESKNVKLHVITIEKDLKFDKHVSIICSKANRKLDVLS